MDTKELYREVLNEHNINPIHKENMDSPTFCLEGVNPSCGDQITLQMKLGPDGKISDASFIGSGCAISQASVDMMAELVIGKTKEECLSIIKEYENMIDEKEYNEELLGEAIVYNDIYKQPSRKKCALLPYKAIKEYLLKGKQ